MREGLVVIVRNDDAVPTTTCSLLPPPTEQTTEPQPATRRLFHKTYDAMLAAARDASSELYHDGKPHRGVVIERRFGTVMEAWPRPQT